MISIRFIRTTIANFAAITSKTLVSFSDEYATFVVIVLNENSFIYFFISVLSLWSKSQTRQTFDVSACEVQVLMKPYCTVSAPYIQGDRTQC